MKAKERIENILRDRHTHTAWVENCKKRGYNYSQICRLNDAMINASSIMASGQQLVLQNDRVWLRYSIDAGTEISVPLKENESVEIYLGSLGYCQIKMVDGEPVNIIQFSEGSEFEKSAKRVYCI